MLFKPRRLRTIHFNSRAQKACLNHSTINRASNLGHLIQENNATQGTPKYQALLSKEPENKVQVKREQFHLLEIEDVDLCASQQLLYGGIGCSPICQKKSSCSQILGIKTIIILLCIIHHLGQTHEDIFYFIGSSDENLRLAKSIICPSTPTSIPLPSPKGHTLC